MRAREDRGRRLPLEVVDRVPRIREPAKRRRLLLDERAHERPVLVERRPVRRRVLLEGERDLRAALGCEGSQAERAQGFVEVRSSQRHARLLRAGRPLSYPVPGTKVPGTGHDWQPGHQ